MQGSTATVAIPTGLAASGGVGAAEQTGATAVLSSDFEMFLKMLTTQMQNQDPLNPLDSSDYATQLATFSSVEQQVLTNDLLRDLSEALTGGNLQQLGSWIGRAVLGDAPVRFDGNPVVLRPEVAPGADTAYLVVRDASGTAVQELPLELSEKVVAWSGFDAGGTPLPGGLYSFSVKSLSGGTELAEAPAKVYNPVIEVRRDGASVLLTLSDGTEIDAESVTAVR